jgi:hypothetical protein
MQSTTTTTINKTSTKNTFSFQKDTVGIKFYVDHIYNFSIEKKFKKDEPGLIDLVSDQPKVFIPMTTSFYHLYYDHFGELLTQYELTPDAKFIIDITHLKDIDVLPEHVKMIFKFLNNNNIDYRPVDLRSNNIMNINNLYYRNLDAESFALNAPAKKLYNFANQYVVDKNVKPSKKVYLSRKNFVNRDLSFFIKGSLPYENDNRIDDEKKLEAYFFSLGFDIVYPDEFKTFEEQMQFFYNVKTVASLTSSGLTNACFMQPGSTVIEITTPLISFAKIGNGVTDSGSESQEELHHFYNAISTFMDHNYISIPNTSRESDHIIKKIENNKILKDFLIG